MPQDDYERYRKRLEEQLHSDIGMLYEAFRAKLRAYETIARSRRGEIDLDSHPAAEGALPVAPAPTPAPSTAARPEDAAAPERREPFAVLDAIRAALATLPEEFDKFDLLEALDFAPRRSTLHEAQKTLEKEGVLAIAREPGGKRPTLYRRAAVASRPTAP
jgi:hypothetical protein